MKYVAYFARHYSYDMPYFVGYIGRSKKQTGPRRLLVAGKGKQAISAEKQRAALGLDKDKDDDDDDAGANDNIAAKSFRKKQAR